MVTGTSDHSQVVASVKETHSGFSQQTQAGWSKTSVKVSSRRDSSSWQVAPPATGHWRRRRLLAPARAPSPPRLAPMQAGPSHSPVAPQIYIFHIYTGPKFTKPTFTQNPDLHKLKFTQLRFTHTQIYTAQYWHTQIYTTQIYTKLNPNLHRPKFTQAQIYIHIFGQISNNPNLHNPNLHKTQIYTA